MKMKFALAGVCALALSLGGCGTTNNLGQQLDADVNGFVNWIDAPATQKAIGTIEAANTAFVCAVANTAALAAEIETGVGAGKSIIGTDGKVYTVSATLCTALGGTTGAQVPVSSIPTS